VEAFGLPYPRLARPWGGSEGNSSRGTLTRVEREVADSGETRRPKRRSAASRAFYSETGRLEWRNLTKLGSGIATAIGIISFVVGLGIRYGELKITVATQTKDIEDLKSTARELVKKRDMQIDRLTYAIKAQNDLIVNLRIAVAAIGAVDEARRFGRYDRLKVLGDDAAKVPETHEQPVKQAKFDAKQALQKARNVNPLKALDQLEDDL
jgi:hypothetical protein